MDISVAIIPIYQPISKQVNGQSKPQKTCGTFGAANRLNNMLAVSAWFQSLG